MPQFRVAMHLAPLSPSPALACTYHTCPYSTAPSSQVEQTGEVPIPLLANADAQVWGVRRLSGTEVEIGGLTGRAVGGDCRRRAGAGGWNGAWRVVAADVGIVSVEGLTSLKMVVIVRKRACCHMSCDCKRWQLLILARFRKVAQ